MIKQPWKVITHLVHVSLDNRDSAQWGLHFCRYVDENRKMIQGKTIGYMDNDGKIIVRNHNKHKIIIGKDENYFLDKKDVGTMIWLEKDD